MHKMRYIGNKESIIEKIYAILQKNGVSGKSVFDFFAGTANVGKFFKANGFRVCSSDILYFSYCLQNLLDYWIKIKQFHFEAGAVAAVTKKCVLAN